MESTVWIAGEIVAPDPRYARAMRYGDGVFVTLRREAGVLLDAEAHLRRLVDACGRVGLDAPDTVASPAALAEALRALGAGERSDLVVRVQVSAGPAGRGYRRADPAGSWEMIELSSAPEARSCRVAVAGPEASLPVPALPDVKSCSALAHVLAAREAQRRGVDELVRTAGGVLTEATAANVFWLSGGALYTPAAALPLYAGITRSRVIEVARDIGWPAREGEYPPAAIAGSEALFLTNATRGIEAVAEIEGRSLPWPEELESLRAAVSRARRDAGTPL